MCCVSFRVKPVAGDKVASINVAVMLVVFPCVLCKDLWYQCLPNLELKGSGRTIHFCFILELTKTPKSICNFNRRCEMVNSG